MWHIPLRFNNLTVQVVFNKNSSWRSSVILKIIDPPQNFLMNWYWNFCNLIPRAKAQKCKFKDNSLIQKLRKSLERTLPILLACCWPQPTCLIMQLLVTMLQGSDKLFMLSWQKEMWGPRISEDMLEPDSLPLLLSRNSISLIFMTGDLVHIFP